jgi:hypothetical protein
MRSNHAAVRFLLVLAVLVPAAAGLGFGSTFLKENVGSLKRASEAVIHAKVSEVRSYWNADHTMIFTEVALEVKGRLHGTSDDVVVVRVPGGTVDDFTVEMEGAPVFDPGDEVVAFIARWQDGAPMVAGYFQGVSKISRDSAGNAILHGGVADGLPMSELARQLRQAGR